MRRGIRRERDGSYRVQLNEESGSCWPRSDAAAEALDADEPSLYRLFPPAFTDDVAANVEYHSLVAKGLEDGKRAALDELERTAFEDRLSQEELESWLGAVESLRLTLGTQLDISDEPIARTRSGRSRPPALPLYHWLSWLQEEVVEALSSGLRRDRADAGRLRGEA